MIRLLDVLEVCRGYDGEPAYLVGGVLDGYSENDVDIVMTKACEASQAALRAALKDVGQPHFTIQDDPPEMFTLLGMDFIVPLKPSKTAATMNELYDLEKLKELDWSYPWYLQPKYTGWHVQVHILPSRASIFTEGARDISKKLPNIVDALKDFPKETMLDAELVIFKGKEMKSQGEVQTYLTSKLPPEDYHFSLFVFDCMILEGKDMRKKTYAERWKVLEGFKFSDIVQLTKNAVVESFDSLKSKYPSVSTNEGFVLKSANMTYNREGMKHFYKWKRQKVIDAEILDVEKKENGYVYSCKVGGEDIGLTYVSDVKAKKGDVLQVQVDKVSNKGGKWSWYAPKVVGLSEKKKPDSKEFLESLLGSNSLPPAPESLGDEDEGKENPQKEISKGSWVLQKHWWGDKTHYDFRLKKGKVMIGWTLTTDPRKPGHHLALEKKYHSTKWLTFEGEMAPGEPGNPTTHLTAHMKIIDSGTYELGERKPNIVHMILEGKKLNGHFILQKMTYAKAKKDQDKWTFRKASTEKLQATFPIENLTNLQAMAVRSGVAMKVGPYVLMNGMTVEIKEEHLKRIADLLPNCIIDFAHNRKAILQKYGFSEPQYLGKITRAWLNSMKQRVEFDAELNDLGDELYRKGIVLSHSIDMDLVLLDGKTPGEWIRVKSLTAVPKCMKPQSEEADEFTVADA